MKHIGLAAAGLLLSSCATSSLVLLPDDDGSQGALAVLEAECARLIPLGRPQWVVEPVAPRLRRPTSPASRLWTARQAPVVRT